MKEMTIKPETREADAKEAVEHILAHARFGMAPLCDVSAHAKDAILRKETA